MDQQEILVLEQQIADAIVHADTAFVDRLFADDFYYTGVRGEIKTKADIVSELASGKLKFAAMKFEDIRVRLFGETAVVTGLAVARGQSPQGEIAGNLRYTRVYVRRQGQWRLVLFQGTPVAS